MGISGTQKAPEIRVHIIERDYCLNQRSVLFVQSEVISAKSRRLTSQSLFISPGILAVQRSTIFKTTPPEFQRRDNDEGVQDGDDERAEEEPSVPDRVPVPKKVRTRGAGTRARLTAGQGRRRGRN